MKFTVDILESFKKVSKRLNLEERFGVREFFGFILGVAKKRKKIIKKAILEETRL